VFVGAAWAGGVEAAWHGDGVRSAMLVV
jgi:hypothetical protein